MKTLEEKIEVMQAFLDGKEVEIFDDVADPCYWESIANPVFNWEYNDYRIKPENKQVPFDFNDAENLIGRMVKNKGTTGISLITCVYYNCLACFAKTINYKEFAEEYEIWNKTLNRWESCTKTVKG